MLYHVLIWKTRWSVFGDDVVGLFVGGGDSYTAARGLVIHKNEVLGWMSLLEGQDDVMQNVVSVLGGVYVALDDLSAIS